MKLNKILMCEFWYDYVQQKYGESAKLCYMNTGSFIAYIKTEDIYADIAKDVEAKLDTSNYELDRLLPEGKNKKVIRSMKEELGGKIIKEFVAFRGQTHTYLTGDNDVDEKSKRHKKVCRKRKI